MFTPIIASCVLLLATYGEALQCYHCYESFNKVMYSGASNSTHFGESFVRCDKNQNKWNTMNCPPQWPACIYMSGTVKDHYEIVRSCGEKDFCSKYKPPNGVGVDYCRECTTNFCNDYRQTPDPPIGPGPLFTFNININLNLTKYRLVSNDAN